MKHLLNFFRVTLRKLYSIIKIPKFEAFQSSATDQQSTSDFEEIVSVSWQQKIFSKAERNYYAQKENCKNETEKRYHQMVKETSGVEGSNDVGLIFTYTDDDNYQPPDNFGPRDVNVTKLRANVEAKEVVEGEKSSGMFTDPKRQIVPSRYSIGDEFVKMFIMADLEPMTLLVSIFYRKSDGLFIIYPDFNDPTNEYLLEIDQNSKQMFVYFVENLSVTFNDSTNQLAQKKKLNKIQEETCELMKKLNIAQVDDFVIPKFCRIALLMEIVDGRDFEFDNIHVQFKVKLPKFVKLVEGSLEGTTHSSLKNDFQWNFGLCHSLVLDIDDEFLFSSSYLDFISFSFEVISIDRVWQRERREGIASLKIPFEGRRTEKVAEVLCFRDLQSGGWVHDFLERFFLGGIHKTPILDQDHGEIFNLYGNKTVSTGTLRVKIETVTQMKPSKRNSLYMKSIDEIISSYHKAKLRLEN